MKNFAYVNKNVWRGSAPLSASDFLYLRDTGVQTVLNLERGFFEFFHHRMNEETENCMRLGMNSVRIEESDFTPPSVKDLHACVSLLQGNQKTYVHCLHGQDRTGMVIAAYRMIECDWDYDKAVDEMLSFGFHVVPYFWWIPRLREIEKYAH